MALAGILPLLERYDNTPLKDTITKVYGTICQMLPNEVEVQSSLVNNVQFISDPLPAIDADVFKKIFEAIKVHKTVSFGYRSISSTSHTPHTLDPYKIYCQKGDWYAVGFCHKHNRYSTYNLSRMKDLVLLSDFEPDPDYEKKVHIDPNFGVWNNELPVLKFELVFDKSINTYIFERTWHKNQKCKQNEDGTVYLCFESNQIQETLYWVLRFGAAVDVLNPPELKEMYENEVHKMAERLKK